MKASDYKYRKRQRPCSFSAGEDVFVRWTDGIQYPGNVKRVDRTKHRCLVEFEDSSCHWVPLKDLSIGADVHCEVCKEGVSKPPNEIVICDACGLGFHQLCHEPVINEDVLEPDVDWYCKGCHAFISGQELSDDHPVLVARNAVSGEPSAKRRPVVPVHNPKSLRWNESHTANTQGVYCYCEGPGHWYDGMLQCESCLQWFHQACLSCLKQPLQIYGCRMWTVTCARCRPEGEIFHRHPFHWDAIAQLALYNLGLKNGRRQYFDFWEELYPFVETHWNLFNWGPYDFRESEKQLSLFFALHHQTKDFACGKEIKKKKTTYRLRHNTVPVRRKATGSEDQSPVPYDMDTLPSVAEMKRLMHGYSRHKSSPSTDTRLCLAGHESDEWDCRESDTEFSGSSSFSTPAKLHDARAEQDSRATERTHEQALPRHRPPDGQPYLDGVAKRVCIPKAHIASLSQDVSQLRRHANGHAVKQLSGADGRIACGESHTVIGCRRLANGRVEYLIRWSGVSI